MKTILLTLAILSGINAFAQNKQLNNSGAAVTEIYNPGIKPSIRRTENTNQFDSIRPLGELNTQYADAYPWISADGLRLYYTDGGNNQIMYTERSNINSYFNAPTVAPLTFAGAISCWLTQNELTMYISDGNAIYRA